MCGTEGSWYLLPSPFLRFENRVNGEWAEGKEVLIRSRSRTLELCGRKKRGRSFKDEPSLRSFFCLSDWKERRAPRCSLSLPQRGNTLTKVQAAFQYHGRAGGNSSGRAVLWVTLLHGSESTCVCDASERVRKSCRKVSLFVPSSTLSMFLRWPKNTLILQP